MNNSPSMAEIKSNLRKAIIRTFNKESKASQFLSDAEIIEIYRKELQELITPNQDNYFKETKLTQLLLIP